MKSKLSALAATALLAACSAVPHHNEQAKALLDEGIALYQKQDYQHAKPYFEQAQQAGHMKAPRYLGLMYLNGEGVAKNAQTAFAYFTQAAAAGDITGAILAGLLLRKRYRHGKRHDPGRALVSEIRRTWRPCFPACH